MILNNENFRAGDIGAGQRAKELKRQFNQICLTDRYLEGEVCAGLGKCYFQLRQYRKAIELHQEHFDIAQQAGDRASQAIACNDLGYALQRIGDFVGAAQTLGHGLSLAHYVETFVGSHDDRRVSLFELQQTAYQQLQGLLLHLGHEQWALGVCAQAKARALTHQLTADSTSQHPKIGGSRALAEDLTYEDMCKTWWDEVLHLARAEGGTRIIEFSFLLNGKLAIWVLSGNGGLMGCVTVPSTGLGGKRTIHQLLVEAREGMNVQGRDVLKNRRERQNKPSAAMSVDVSASRDQRGNKCKVCGFRLDKCTCAGFGACDKEKERVKKDKELLEKEKELLRELYTVLIAPVEELLIDAKDLLILPHKELFEVPWAALIDSSERYFIELYIIRVAPSLRVARQAADNMHNGEDGHILVVGNPFPISDFDPLPLAEEEAGKVFDILTSAGIVVRDFFKTDKANKENVKHSLHSAIWGHFACHGDLDKNALVLAIPSNTNTATNQETNLSMIEVQSVRLAKGSTLVLSACNTGRGEIKAEGVLGLSRGFLLAGASSTVVSLWSVDDGSTSELMQRMYQHLVAGCTVPEALRLSMLYLARRPALENVESGDSILADGLCEEWKRPMHWAGFLVVGASTCLLRHANGTYCRPRQEILPNALVMT